jgi:hypothetical protein
VADGPEPSSFLSGETGHVAGVRRTVWRTLGDALLDAGGIVRGRRLDRLAAQGPARDLLILSIYRPGARRLRPALDELRRSRHRLRLALGSTGEALPGVETAATGLTGGKFQNLNLLLETAGATRFDWLLVVDDDVLLPRHFLDRFIAACEHFDLALAQPAQTLMSHAAWRVTRRRARSYARETRFVEVGPVTAFRADTTAELTPFPDLRFGWGLDLHWAALARERGWRLGIVDAVPVRHDQAVASAYSHAAATDEAQRFLAVRPFVTAKEAQETLAVHRRLSR